MENKTIFFLVVLFFVIIYIYYNKKNENLTSTTKRTSIVYYADWGQSILKPQSLTVNCTHIFYAFATFDSFYNIITADSTGQGYKNILTLKNTNPSLKLSIAFGGGAFSYNLLTSQILANMLSSQSNRSIFISNAINHVRLNKFDGIDIDFENLTLIPNIVFNLNFFFKELRSAIILDSQTRLLPQLILSSATSVDPYEINALYPITPTKNYLLDFSLQVDFFQVMAYDMRSGYESTTGLHAQLKPNTITGINTYLNAKVSRNKIVLGVPAYGIGYTLKSTANGIGAPTSGPSKSGIKTQTPGLLSYNEIVSISGKVVENLTLKGTYKIYNTNQWIGYDSITSAQNKAQYVKTNGLLGVAIWVAHFDDNVNKFPLINTYIKALAL